MVVHNGSLTKEWPIDSVMMGRKSIFVGMDVCGGQVESIVLLEISTQEFTFVTHTLSRQHRVNTYLSTHTWAHPRRSRRGVHVDLRTKLGRGSASMVRCCYVHVTPRRTPRRTPPREELELSLIVVRIHSIGTYIWYTVV